MLEPASFRLHSSRTSAGGRQRRRVRSIFPEGAIERLGGARVMMLGNRVYRYGIAREGLDAGRRRVFARDSLIHTAGGLKGRKLPDNYREVVREFLGGIPDGHRLTIDWDGRCACGRIGPRIHGDKIGRYSEDEGGDDEISCAGALDVHEKALAFITEMI